MERDQLLADFGWRQIHDATSTGASATSGSTCYGRKPEAAPRAVFVEDCRSRRPILVAGLDGRSRKLPEIANNSIGGTKARQPASYAMGSNRGMQERERALPARRRS